MTKPNPEDFASGVLGILPNEAFGKEIGNKAKEVAETKYSYSAFLSKTKDVYSYIESLRGK